MRRSTSLARLAAIALFAVVARGAEPATPAAPVVAPGIVELPKFEVTDSRVLPQPEKWRYAAIPGFEVLSKISERETRRFVNDFLLLQSAINILMPGIRRDTANIPTSLVLCGRGSSFDRFMPDDRGDDIYRTNSLFFDDPERGAIIVDFALSELQLDGGETMEADPYRSFYKEYFRHLIRHEMGGRPPPWFEEGLVEMFSAIDFNKKWITFAQIGDGFGGHKDNDFNQMLNERGLMPLPEMFGRTAVSTDRIWSAQCYAFVHMCLYGRNQRYQQGFLKMLNRAGNEVPTEEMFKECFNKSYKDMALELRGYIGFTDYKAMQYTAKKGESLPDPPPFELREATEAESGRIVGETLRLGKHGEAAHLALIAPYIRGSREPQLIAALGLDERLAGKDDRARKFLEAAVTAKAPRPRAYLELARIRYAEVMQAAAKKEDRRLSEAQVADVLEPLAAARSVPPPLAEIYELAAEVLGRGAKKPGKEDIRFVNEGVVRFPRRPLLLVRGAELNLRHGDPEDARKIIDFGLKAIPNSPARLALVSLSEELPPAPPTPTPAATPTPAPKAPASKAAAPKAAPKPPPEESPSDLLKKEIKITRP